MGWDWGDGPQGLRWGTAHVSVPPIFGKHVMHTDENKLCTLTLWSFVNAIQAKYVPSDEMTKKGHQNFWVEKLN